MCMAQRTAPSILSNAIKRESPPVWTIRPPCWLIVGSIRLPRRDRSQPHQRPGVVQANKAAIADHVGINDRHQFPPIRRSFSRVRCLRFRHARRFGSIHSPVMVYSRSETFYRTVRPPERHQCCGHAMEKISPPPNSGRFSASASVASRYVQPAPRRARRRRRAHHAGCPPPGPSPTSQNRPPLR